MKIRHIIITIVTAALLVLALQSCSLFGTSKDARIDMFEDDLNYDRLTAANAVRFKRKWRGVIEREGGMPDADVPAWKRDVGWRPVEEIGRLELVD